MTEPGVDAGHALHVFGNPAKHAVRQRNAQRDHVVVLLDLRRKLLCSVQHRVDCFGVIGYLLIECRAVCTVNSKSVCPVKSNVQTIINNLNIRMMLFSSAFLS